MESNSISPRTNHRESDDHFFRRTERLHLHVSPLAKSLIANTGNGSKYIDYLVIQGFAGVMFQHKRLLGEGWSEKDIALACALNSIDPERGHDIYDSDGLLLNGNFTGVRDPHFEEDLVSLGIVPRKWYRLAETHNVPHISDALVTIIREHLAENARLSDHLGITAIEAATCWPRRKAIVLQQ